MADFKVAYMIAATRNGVQTTISHMSLSDTSAQMAISDGAAAALGFMMSIEKIYEAPIFDSSRSFGTARSRRNACPTSANHISKCAKSSSKFGHHTICSICQGYCHARDYCLVIVHIIAQTPDLAVYTTFTHFSQPLDVRTGSCLPFLPYDLQ